MACRELVKERIEQDTDTRGSNQREKHTDQGQKEPRQKTYRHPVVICPWCCKQVQQAIRHMTSGCVVRFDHFKSDEKPEVKKRIAETDYNKLKEGQKDYHKNLCFSAEELAEKLGKSHIETLPKVVEILLDFGHVLVPRKLVDSGRYPRQHRSKNGLMANVKVELDYIKEKYGTRVTGTGSSTTGPPETIGYNSESDAGKKGFHNDLKSKHDLQLTDVHLDEEVSELDNLETGTPAMLLEYGNDESDIKVVPEHELRVYIFTDTKNEQGRQTYR
ncbi:uncharacterized protein [Argopecten irradians]|uniref:uncharacterized protein n=1 Tax=Argopecten irradians TaxID=31199 RepID=UPI00371C35B9